MVKSLLILQLEIKHSFKVTAGYFTYQYKFFNFIHYYVYGTFLMVAILYSSFYFIFRPHNSLNKNYELLCFKAIIHI